MSHGGPKQQVNEQKDRRVRQLEEMSSQVIDKYESSAITDRRSTVMKV
jgi:hypothetical protein